MKWEQREERWRREEEVKRTSEQRRERREMWTIDERRHEGRG